MAKSIGLEKVADTEELLFLLETLIDGLKRKQLEGQVNLPWGGITLVLGQARELLETASLRLSKELSNGKRNPENIEEAVNSGLRQDSGFSLAERIQQIPVQKNRARELNVENDRQSSEFEPASV